MHPPRKRLSYAPAYSLYFTSAEFQILRKALYCKPFSTKETQFTSTPLMVSKLDQELTEIGKFKHKLIRDTAINSN